MTNAASIDFYPNPSRLRLWDFSFDEFHRSAVPAFQKLFTEIEARTIETFEEADLEDGWEPDRARIVRPSATWTYLVHDNPFGSELDRLIAAVGRRLLSRD